MYRTSAVVAGLVAGIIGATIWAVVALVTGYEVGWIAWGVGALVGFGVALGNKGEGGVPAGVLAVVIAIMALLGGKYATVQLVLRSQSSELVEMTVARLQDDELVISYIADDVAETFVQQGRPVEWPEGVDPSAATSQSDYPADVWEVAVGRWESMSPQEREDFRSGLEEMIRGRFAESMLEIRRQMAQEGFFRSFGGLDILFFGLAVVTAFKIGASGGTRDKRELHAAFHQAVKRAMVTMMVADGEIDDAEIEVIRTVYGRLCGSEISEADVREEAASVEQAGEDVLARLRGLAPNLNEKGKELVIRAAIMVAAADGSVGEQEQQLLGRIAESIEMSPAHFRGIITEVAGGE